MATLVLSTAGTLLGGPVGGAIGSLLGQSIDQQLLGPGPRQGPRLGDLSVQNSSYGSPVPRIYGTMRVAGTVVWSTDLQESSQTEAAKGQPGTTTYSYSVSFAVALSSRNVAAVKRIWADGNLLRGAAGDFKVATGFRFYSGDEEQLVDPLIASVEGMDSTPAYRGLALAVFENLQLADFGNRIPFLTFEVEADSEPPSLADILADATEGVIVCSDSRTLPGYAAYGQSMQSAIQPVVDQFGVELFDDADTLRSPGDLSRQAQATELGCGAGSDPQPRLERSQTAARLLPSVLTLRYYDPDRDYQAAQARAGSGTSVTQVEAVDLPAVLGASAARALAETSLARAWAERDTLTLRLPASYLTLEPGMVLSPPGEPVMWSVDTVAVDSMAVVVRLHPKYGAVDLVAADAGRALESVDEPVQPTTVALIELGTSQDLSADQPVVLVAAANAASTWRPVPLTIDCAGAVSQSRTATLPTILGTAQTALPGGQSSLFDCAATVDVQLVDPDRWLESRDDDALVNGENVAIIGSELIQFGIATPLGAGQFRLSRLLRGRRGTEWAMASHSAGETFALIDPGRLQQIQVDPGQVGAAITVTPNGLADSASNAVTLVVDGEALRPPSPVHLEAQITASGDLACSWCRRSRLGWAWIDGVDAPLGCSTELYQVQLTGLAGSIELETGTPAATFSQAQLQSAGGGEITVTVAQVGDLATSRPSSIQLSV